MLPLFKIIPVFKIALIITIFVTVAACSTTSQAPTKQSPEILSTITKNGATPLYQSDDSGDYFILTEYSTNPEYGLTPEFAIKVGGGPSGEFAYMNSLKGPNSETISFTRRGSCCPFEDETLLMGGGLLDVYEVYYDEAEEPITLFLNMYQENKELFIPKGLTAK